MQLNVPYVIPVVMIAQSLTHQFVWNQVAKAIGFGLYLVWCLDQLQTNLVNLVFSFPEA